jgi:hypothetical protein
MDCSTCTVYSDNYKLLQESILKQYDVVYDSISASLTYCKSNNNETINFEQMVVLRESYLGCVEIKGRHLCKFFL